MPSESLAHAVHEASRPTHAAISIDHLTIRLGEAIVLSEVSVEIERGGFVTIIGANGAGKTTLLRSIDGLVSPAAGTIRINGERIGALSRRSLARQVSYVPQSEPPGLDSLDYDVRSFVAMGRYPHLTSWSGLGPEDHRQIDLALERTETSHLAGRSMASLSGGERQRVQIAAALAQGGSILLLDEPTSFLDYRHQARIIDLLERLHRLDRLTIVAVSHDLNGPVTVSDSILALRKGKVMLYDQPRAVLEAKALERVFDTRFELISCPPRPLPVVIPARLSRS